MYIKKYNKFILESTDSFNYKLPTTLYQKLVHFYCINILKTDT